MNGGGRGMAWPMSAEHRPEQHATAGQSFGHQVLLTNPLPAVFQSLFEFIEDHVGQENAAAPPEKKTAARETVASLPTRTCSRCGRLHSTYPPPF